LKVEKSIVKYGLCFVLLVVSSNTAFSQGITKAMVERQYAVTCAQQNQRSNPSLVYQCQLWRSQIDAMEDGTGTEESEPPPLPRAPSFQTPAPPSTIKQSAPSVNQCISIRTNQWGSRQFFNGCDFTVSISWCAEEQGSAFSCRGAKINGQGLNFINPGSEQPVGGKEGRVHFVACRGGPSSGSYASVKEGIPECR
jgi:hypothetical protein